MADRPILFSAPMVRALLSGKKTQTRRVLKPRPGLTVADLEDHGERAGGDLRCARDQVREPAYAVGDRLWVRESGHLLREAFGPDPTAGRDLYRDAGFQHAADGAIVPARAYDTPLAEWAGDCARVARPSIHMPRWASRITLLVDEVRVQRLQEITDADCWAEGLERIGRDGSDFHETYPRTPRNVATYTGAGGSNSNFICPRLAFSHLWRSINGPGSWDANPWVVAISFGVVLANIDRST